MLGHTIQVMRRRVLLERHGWETLQLQPLQRERKKKRGGGEKGAALHANVVSLAACQEEMERRNKEEDEGGKEEKVTRRGLHSKGSAAAWRVNRGGWAKKARWIHVHSCVCEPSCSLTWQFWDSQWSGVRQYSDCSELQATATCNPPRLL